MRQPTDVHVVVATQNADVTTDRRPCAMADALVRAGYRVTLVGPTADPESTPALEHSGVAFRPFSLPRAATGALGQVREQLTATVRMAVAVVGVARRDPVDVVHVGNPPDHGWILPGLLRLVLRKRVVFVYDQHDPAPLIVADKFGDGLSMGLVAGALRVLERLALARADLAVFANLAFEARARRLGYSGPAVVAENGWTCVFAGDADPAPWVVDQRPLLAYVGTTNAQDCVGHLVQAVASLGREVQLVVAGDGDARAIAEAQGHQLGVARRFTWLGWVQDRRTIARLLAQADVCVAPEIASPANDLTSFVKVMEYMSAAGAIAAHRLPQTEAVAGDTAEYATDESPAALAAAIERILDDPAAARRRGVRARERFERLFRWESVGAPRLVDGYAASVLPRLGAGGAPARPVYVQPEGE
jgi:glycosyltransferase involved in cell wall biosynthesis